jgi:hypothetical protein
VLLGTCSLDIVLWFRITYGDHLTCFRLLIAPTFYYLMALLQILLNRRHHCNLTAYWSM